MLVYKKEGKEQDTPAFFFLAIVVFFALMASYFLLLAPQKVTKEEGTQPSRPNGSLALLATAATLNIATRVSLRRNRLLRSLSYQQSNRSRNSTWQLTNKVSYCGIQTVAPFSLTLFPLLSVMEWDGSRQTHIAEFWTVQKSKYVAKSSNRWRTVGVGPLSDAPSSAVSVGGVGQRLFEFRGGLRSAQAARASFVGRPR